MLPQVPYNEIQGHPKVQSVVPRGQAWIGRGKNIKPKWKQVKATST